MLRAQPAGSSTMMIGLIVGGVACILGGAVIFILMACNSSSDGDVVEKFFKKSAIAYWGLLGALLVVGGIGMIAKGATSKDDKPAAASSPGKHK
jgi:hypothetical protein